MLYRVSTVPYPQPSGIMIVLLPLGQTFCVGRIVQSVQPELPPEPLESSPGYTGGKSGGAMGAVGLSLGTHSNCPTCSAVGSTYGFSSLSVYTGMP